MMIAGGIKKFQAEAPDELSPGVKQWLGYHATLELAKSPNTKVMVLKRRRNARAPGDRPLKRFKSPEAQTRACGSNRTV